MTIKWNQIRSLNVQWKSFCDTLAAFIFYIEFTVKSRTQLPHVERELFRVFPLLRPKLGESVTENESKQHMWMDIMGKSVSVIQLVNT